MASSGSRRKKKRKHAGYRGDLRFVKTRPEKKKKRTSRSAKTGSTSAKKSGRKKGSTAPKKTAVRKSPAASSGDGADVRGVTPGWEDLLTDNSPKTASLKTPEGRLAAMSTAKVAIGILAVAGLFTLYVGHIYATQDLLADVQRLRTENWELSLQKNQVSSAWDRATAPHVISRRARELNFRESVPQGEPIIVED